MSLKKWPKPFGWKDLTSSKQVALITAPLLYFFAWITFAFIYPANAPGLLIVASTLLLLPLLEYLFMRKCSLRIGVYSGLSGFLLALVWLILWAYVTYRLIVLFM